MKTILKSAYLSNPELELLWVVKQQIHLVRTKMLRAVKGAKVSNLVVFNKAISKQIEPTIVEIPSTGNEALDLYYLEGMKLFGQGPYAKKRSDNKDQLGLFL